VDFRLIVKTQGVRISLGGKVNIFQVTINIKDGRCDFKESFREDQGSVCSYIA